MAGNIYHEWDGTTLIITSDSGTSACDLQGQKGDIGVRGPQGIPGNVMGQEALDTKVDKVTETSYYQRLYGVNAKGEQKIFEIPGSRSAVANGRVPQYYANDFGDDTIPSGVLLTGNPMKACHATPKGYVDNLFNGANKAVSFVNYSSMIASLNALDNSTYGVGQNIMIVTLEVPDLWVSEIAEESVIYTYVSDDDFVNELNTNGSVQIGYYKLSALETQKVDLSQYATNEALDGKVNRKTDNPGGIFLYGQDGNKKETQYQVANVTGSMANLRIPMYFSKTNTQGDNKPSNGVLICGDAEKPYHAANKNYVDNAIANALANVGGGKLYKRILRISSNDINIQLSAYSTTNGKLPFEKTQEYVNYLNKYFTGAVCSMSGVNVTSPIDYVVGFTLEDMMGDGVYMEVGVGVGNMGVHIATSITEEDPVEV